MTKEQRPSLKSSLLITIFFLFTVIIGASAYYYYKSIKQETKTEAFYKISDLAVLKVNEIIKWRKERTGEALFIYEAEDFKNLVYNFLKEPDDNLKNRIINWINPIVKNHEYTDAIIIGYSNIPGKTGKVYSLFRKDEDALDDSDYYFYKKCIEDKKFNFSDLNIQSSDKKITMGSFVPFFLNDKEDGKVFGVFVLRIDPEEILFPLIKAKPALSKTAESFIVRREGDHVLFLNELRNRKNSALTFKIPLSQKDLPAVNAVLGHEGIFEGIDYIGNEVLSDVRKIPDSPWYIVSKINDDEVYALLHERVYLIVAFSTILLLITGAGIYVSWKNQKLSFYKIQLKLEKDKKDLLKHLEHLLKNANDIILLLDSEGKIKDANEKTVQVYGYTQYEMLKLNIQHLRAPEIKETFEDTKKKLEESDGLVFDTIHIKKSGEKFPVEVSSKKIELNGTTFYQFIIRDISERKRAEEAVRESERRMNRSQEIAHLGSWELDIINDKLTWSDGVYRIFGLKPQQFDATYEVFLEAVHPDDRNAVDEAYSGSIRDGKDSYEIEHRVVRKSTGEIRVVHEKCEHFRDQSGKIIRSVGMVQDITERKQADEALRKAHNTISEIVHRISDAFFAVDKEWNFIYINHIAKNLGFSYELIGKNVWQELPVLKNSILEENLKKAMALQQPVHFEWKGVISNGWFNISAYPSEDGVTVYAQDVTNDIDAKHKLKKLIGEKEVLLKEVHHRVKNNLQTINSLLNLQANFIDDDYVKKIFLDSQNRIRSMALIHQELYTDNIEYVNTQKYIDKLVAYLVITLDAEKRKIKINKDIEEKFLAIDAAVPLGLLINEIFSNIFKHAFPNDMGGTIRVEFKETSANEYELFIADNGIGLPFNFDHLNSATLGMQLIYNLAMQLDGEVKIRNEEGTVFIIKMKITDKIIE